jgi:type II secretory pathway pseudopilin PulG
MTVAKPRMSKPFFLGSILALIAVDILIPIGVFWAVGQSRSGNEGVSVAAVALLMVVLGCSLIYEIVVTCLLVYKMWHAIQDGQARTTPGKAVGLLFIPFYGLYWIFVAFRGFALDYNALLDRHQLELPRLPTGLFTAFAVLSLISGIPYLGCLALLPLLVVFPILAVKTCDAVNALPEFSLKPPEAMTHEELVQAAKKRQSAGTPGWVWAIVGIGGGIVIIMFIGIIAAIAIPNLLIAKEKAAVRKTMQDIQRLAVAMETYSVDHGRYPTVVSADELADILQKENFGTNLVTCDAWGHPFIVEIQSDSGHYCIISLGQNGLRDAQEPYSDLPRENPLQGADIVLVDGEFVSYPAGARR